MEFRQLKTFLMIAKLGSFSKAANILGYAQSTITMQIQALEEELGTILFERGSRKIGLTREGENLYWYAEQILKLTEEAIDSTTCGDQPKGTIVIGTPESLCLNRLHELIKEYRLYCPEVEIKLRFGTCCDLHDMLSKNLIDIAFFLDEPISEDKLVTHVLFNEPVLLLASPKHPLASKACVTPEDIHGEFLILTESGCNYRARFESFTSSQQIHPCSTMEVSSVEIIKRFTRDNLGITVLSKTAVQDELDQNQLIALPWTGPSFDVSAQMVYQKEKKLSPALKRFIALTLDRMRKLTK
ncbi:MAG TPA: LysR family transcriptional regulator [Clostridia bacterium]|nr:LysR family transcriptional regulator [Clostridia bacterium]